MNKVLIPIDFSKNSLRAIEYGLKFAEEYGRLVTLLYSFDGNQPGNIHSSARKILEKEAQIKMDNVLSNAQKIAPSVELDTVITRGVAADEIVQKAKA